jgi:hypothetical protein
VSARKIGLLILLLGFGAVVETAWQVRGDWRIGPEGCRVIGGRFYGPSYSFEQTAERALTPARPHGSRSERLRRRERHRGSGTVKVKLRKVVFSLPRRRPAFADRIELRVSATGRW